MAATNPRRNDDERDDIQRTGMPPARSERGAIATGTSQKPRRSVWFWVILGVVILAIIGVIGYLVLYSGGSGYSSGGTGGGTGGGGGGGGYFIVAFSAEQMRQLVKRLRNRK